jgi:hypothetical protein
LQDEILLIREKDHKKEKGCSLNSFRLSAEKELFTHSCRAAAVKEQKHFHHFTRNMTFRRRREGLKQIQLNALRPDQYAPPDKAPRQTGARGCARASGPVDGVNSRS